MRRAGNTFGLKPAPQQTGTEPGIEMGGVMKRFDNKTVVVTGGGGGIG